MQDKIRIEKERRFWDDLGSGYDGFISEKWKIYASSLVDRIVEDVTGETILEVACGTGLVAQEVAKQHEKVCGVDISPQMIKEALKKVKEKGIRNVEFSVKDAYALPFDDGMFDTVICCNALHNMKHPEGALSEIKRVLAPEGRLIVSIVGIGESRKYRIGFRIYQLFGGKIPVFHYLSLDEAARMITESGFIVVKKEIMKHPEDAMPLLYILGELKK